MKGNEGKSEKLSREKAEELIKEWADFLELDTDRELYDDLVEELRMPVRNQRLTFEKETETFRYQLINPVGDKNIVEIKDCNFEDKKIIQKYKDTETIESSVALLSKYTNFTAAEVGKLKTRDSTKMTAVAIGFLAQVAPGRR